MNWIGDKKVMGEYIWDIKRRKGVISVSQA